MYPVYAININVFVTTQTYHAGGPGSRHELVCPKRVEDSVSRCKFHHREPARHVRSSLLAILINSRFRRFDRTANVLAAVLKSDVG